MVVAVAIILALVIAIMVVIEAVVVQGNEQQHSRLRSMVQW